MKIRDILHLSTNNLYRRKGRTLLTVSGVVIGCCAVVIMISMGLGMKKAQDQMLESMGNLMRITVMPAPERAAKRIPLDKKAVVQMKKISHVKTAIPKKTLDLGEFSLVSGEKERYVYEGLTVTGIYQEDLEAAGYQLKEGRKASGSWEALGGEHLAYQFIDSKRPEGKNMVDYWSDENAKPYFPILKDDVSFAKKNGTNTEGENAAIQNGSTSWNILQKLKVTGLLKEDMDLGDETDMGLLLNMKDFEQLEKLMKVEKKKEYSQVSVYVESIKDVEMVEKQIKDMKFETISMESIRKPMEKDMQQKQMMLAGLGAVSLFVAAIGIANTMIMSITERTREIGIMKALGCGLSEIRKEFLIEAGLIGLLGGCVGTAVSSVLSILMNRYAGSSFTGDTSMYMMGESAASGGISIIPPWLIVFAIVFSVIMGVAAGYLPSSRAVKISALEAMKA